MTRSSKRELERAIREIETRALTDRSDSSAFDVLAPFVTYDHAAADNGMEPVFNTVTASDTWGDQQ